jgi:hypothetical protein
VAIVDIHDPTALALRRFDQRMSLDILRVAGDRLYLASGWAGLELAQVQELNEQAWLPFALSQTSP